MKDTDLKKRVEYLYTNAVYNDESPNNFASKIMEEIGEDEKRQPKTSKQRRSKWKYLSMVANDLNGKGYGFKANGLDCEVSYTKEMLDAVYWKTMRDTLYPGKKRLSTKDEANVADHVLSLFAMVFDIHIPFPNIRDYLQQKEYERYK